MCATVCSATRTCQSSQPGEPASRASQSSQPAASTSVALVLSSLRTPARHQDRRENQQKSIENRPQIVFYETLRLCIGIAAESALACILSTSRFRNTAPVHRNRCRERSRLHSEHPGQSRELPGPPGGIQAAPGSAQEHHRSAPRAPGRPPGEARERPGGSQGRPGEPGGAKRSARERQKATRGDRNRLQVAPGAEKSTL